MNSEIIRICEIALSTISELKCESHLKFMREVEENVKSAVSSNLASRDLEFRNSILEQQEIIIRTMMKLAYEKEIVLRDMEET